MAVVGSLFNRLKNAIEPISVGQCVSQFKGRIASSSRAPEHVVKSMSVG